MQLFAVASFRERNNLLIPVMGKKTGKAYTIGVNYERRREGIDIISRRNRTWRRNLRNSAAVTLRLQGRGVKDMGTVIEENADIVKSLKACVEKLLHKEVSEACRNWGVMWLHPEDACCGLA
jgi:hypothetical protein